MEDNKIVKVTEVSGYFRPDEMKMIRCVCGNYVCIDDFLLFGDTSTIFCSQCNRVWFKLGRGIWLHTGKLKCDICGKEKEELFRYRDSLRTCSECSKKLEKIIESEIEERKEELRKLREYKRFDPDTITTEENTDIVFIDESRSNGGRRQHYETKKDE